jgi:Leucine-rich repeat (LRR) protein
MALVTCAVTSAQQLGSKKRPGKSIPETIREDWEVAGAELEWEQPPGVDQPFVGEEAPENFPTFAFGERPRGRFARLPAPDVPFGVDMVGWPVNTAALKDLAAMKNLQFLDVSVGLTDEALKALAGAAELRSLTLGVSGTRVTGAGINELAALKELRELVIRGGGPDNRAAALQRKGEMSGFKSLRRLALSSIPTTDAAFKDIGSLGELRRLQLSQVRVTDASLAELAKLPKLQSLEIHGDDRFTKDVTADGLKALTGAAELRELFLWDFPMTEEGVKHLATMKGLRALHLYNTPVSDGDLKHLAALSGLEYLVLTNSHSRITEAGVKHLAALKELRTLQLRYATITDEAAKTLGGLTKLQSLGVAATWLTNGGLKHITNLTDLESLDIMGNSALTVETFKPLERLTKLKTLYLSGTKMYGTPERDRHLAELRKALPKCEISTEGGYIGPGRSTPP